MHNVSSLCVVSAKWITNRSEKKILSLTPPYYTLYIRGMFCYFRHALCFSTFVHLLKFCLLQKRFFLLPISPAFKHAVHIPHQLMDSGIMYYLWKHWTPVTSTQYIHFTRKFMIYYYMQPIALHTLKHTKIFSYVKLDKIVKTQLNI